MQQSKSVAIVLGPVVVCNKSKDVWSEGRISNLWIISSRKLNAMNSP